MSGDGSFLKMIDIWLFDWPVSWLIGDWLAGWQVCGLGSQLTGYLTRKKMEERSQGPGEKSRHYVRWNDCGKCARAAQSY